VTTEIIYIPQRLPGAAIRLLCFSYAGGSAATYVPWLRYLNKNVELAVVQLPGRGARLSERPYETLSEMVKDIFIALNKLDNKPLILFGHSMGARVAYELLLLLYRFRYRLPVHFVASGSVAPCAEKPSESIYRLPDEEFIQKLKELNGSPAEVLANREIMQLMMPALRADFKIIENYCNKSRLKIPVGLSVLMGDEEDVDFADIEAWFGLFHCTTGINRISGGHFFIESNRPAVVSIVNDIVDANLKSLAIR